jgi:hypothetical protein
MLHSALTGPEQSWPHALQCLWFELRSTHRPSQTPILGSPGAPTKHSAQSATQMPWSPQAPAPAPGHSEQLATHAEVAVQKNPSTQQSSMPQS